MNASSNGDFVFKRANTGRRKQTPQETERKGKKQRQIRYIGYCKGHKNKNGEDALFDLLQSSSHDSQSIIKAAQHSSKPSTKIYDFTFEGEQCGCYPLHQAIKIGAACNILDFLHTSFPVAMEETSTHWGDTALHIAITHRASPEVVSFVLEKWPSALKVRNQDKNQPLHDAVVSDTPMEVISLLVHKWPGGIKEEGDFLATPLHLACGREKSFELVSLFANKCPDAAKKKDESGLTPLHIVCLNNASMEYVLCLLEKWPEAVKEKDDCGETPLLIAKRKKASDSIQKVLSFVTHLCGDEVNELIANKAVLFFIEIEWHGGVALVLDRYPAVVQTLHVSMKVFPALLSFVGRFCNMSSLRDILSNKQELLVSM